MGSKSSSPLDIVAGVATGGIYTVAKYYNDKRLEAKREARTAADQAKDAMLSQELKLKEENKKNKQAIGNNLIRNRLIAMRAYGQPSNRSGTLIQGASSTYGTASIGNKTLLGT